MALYKVATVQTENRELNQAQRNIITQLNQLIDNPLLNGVVVTRIDENGMVVTDIPLTTAGNPNIVSHTLGRNPIGYLVVKNTTESTIWDSQSLYVTDPTDTINTYGPQSASLLINTSADTTVSLYVF